MNETESLTIDSFPEATLIVSEESDKVMSCNNVASTLLNVNKDVIVGRELKDLFVDLEFAEETSNGIRYGTGTYVDKDQNRMPITMSMMRKNVMYLVVTLHDLTQWSSILESTPDAMVMIDENGIIKQFNHEAERLFHLDKSEVLDRPIETLIPDRFTTIHRQHRTKFFQHPKHRPMGSGLQLYGKRKDKSEFSAEVMLSPVTLNNNTYVLASVRDVTERKRMEEIEKYNRRILELTKNNFVSNISHDMLTPVHAIQGVNEILRTTKDNSEDSVKLLEEQRQAVTTLSHMIQNLLNYSSLMKGAEMQMAPAVVCDLIRKVAKNFQKACDNKGLTLSLNLPYRPYHVVIDEDKLTVILNNLVSNAVKFTERGSVTINLAVDDESDEMVTMRIEVADTGIGIDAHLDLMKETIAWHRQNPSYTRHNEGIGIGLLVSQELLELMSSSLHYTSTKGEGSTFWFTLHVSKVVDDKVTKTALSNNENDMNLTNLLTSLLIVDDNHVNVSILLRYCKILLPDIPVDVAYDGVEAVEKYKEKEHDMIIMDIQMPNMDGIEATRTIREYEINRRFHDGRTKKALIIALTAHGLHDRPFAINAGMNDYLVKPIDMTTLRRLFDKYNHDAKNDMSRI